MQIILRTPILQIKQTKFFASKNIFPLSYNEITINYGHRLYSYSKYK